MTSSVPVFENELRDLNENNFRFLTFCDFPFFRLVLKGEIGDILFRTTGI